MLVYTQTGDLIHFSDWADNTSDRHSYIGYAYLLGGVDFLEIPETTINNFIVH